MKRFMKKSNVIVASLVVLLFLFLSLANPVTAAPVLKEEYFAGDDDFVNVYGANRWMFQTFTTTSSYTITSVYLLLYRAGLPSTLNIEIYACDASHYPTGVALCSGTTDGDTLDTSSPFTKRQITLGAGALLVDATEYAIVLKDLTGIDPPAVRWRVDSDGSGGGYAGGRQGYTTDGGASWGLYGASQDAMFEVWGDAGGGGGWAGTVDSILNPSGVDGILPVSIDGISP